MNNTSLKAQVNVDPDKKQEKINEDSLKLLLMQKHFDNIQHFLSAYKESTNFTLLSKEFTKDSYVFMKQSQIPDCWIKTQTPFNRNHIFYLNVLANNRSFYNKNHKKGGAKIKQWNIAPNYYPKVPFNFNKDGLLVSSQKKIENKSNKNDPEEAEMVFAGLTKKSWIVNYCQKNEILSYGPMSSLNVYFFLKNIYNEIKTENKEKRSIMIVDTKYDVHYRPETLFQFLDEEYSHCTSEGALELKPIKTDYAILKEKEENYFRSKEDGNQKQNCISEQATAYSSLNNKEERTEIGENN